MEPALPLRNISTLTALAALLLLSAASAYAAVQSNENDERDGGEAVVLSTCAVTLYPDLCVSSIKEAKATADAEVKSPRDVLLTALNFTIQVVGKNYATVKKIGGGRNLTVRERTALDDCLEVIDDTLAELGECKVELRDYGTKNYTLASHKERLMMLLSAAQTNQESCIDGFSHDDADRKVRKALIKGQMHVFRLVSNVLAMIKNLTTTSDAVAEAGVHSFAGVSLSPSSTKRKLGEGGSDKVEWPNWLSVGDRRLLQATSVIPDVIVAADGSGNYSTVSEAVAAAPRRSTVRYVIRIKAGVYRENVEIPRQKTNLMFLGDDRQTTIITGNRNVVDGSTTFRSATVAVVGDGFLARNLTFENTAGPSKHQAVALRINADLSAVYHCNILAYQDTLYVHSLRQFYTGCYIAGTVDFIFGNAAVVLQNCDIRARRPNSGQRNMVTAQSRDDPNESTGIVIHRCTIGATSDLEAVASSFPTYLGRPWKMYSRTVVMQTEISSLIHPAGWFEWNGDFAKETLYYAEHENTGSGADTSSRVTWGGVRPQISATEAQEFTVGTFIGGENWLPETGFPFSLGL